MAARKSSQPAVEGAPAGYTVLARRYRSRDFDELIGQEPVARTLKNAIASGRTAHAYLFCGTRGVGKTSMARIFAKALNATGDLAQKDQIAEAILRGDDLDVIEIDGASNRGIADAKDLIAGAGLSPARCKYKVYIIDEVHMLTREAFNALLKTMEEPPVHVKFILCTTEAHKVPSTIQSRCQRFDFRPISAARIAEQLRMILKKEKIKASDDVVIQVAQLGNGSMRDALSLLDRLLAAGDDTLTAELLEEMVGLPDQSLMMSLVDAFVDHDAAAALERADELVRRGTPVEQILDLLAAHFRTLMIISACGNDTELVELSTEARKKAEAQARHFDAAGLVHLIAMCDSVACSARASSVARALLDAAVVRMAMSEHFADVTALLRGNGAVPAESVTPRKKKALSTPSESAQRAEPDAQHQAVPTASSLPPDQSYAEPKPLARPQEAAPELTGDDDRAGMAIWSALTRAAVAQQSLRAKIDHLSFKSFDGRTLRLNVGEEAAGIARVLGMQTAALSNLIKQHTGRSVAVELDLAQSGPESQPVARGSALDEARSLPLVKEAMSIFDASVVDVQDDTESARDQAATTRKGEKDV